MQVERTEPDDMVVVLRLLKHCDRAYFLGGIDRRTYISYYEQVAHFLLSTPFPTKSALRARPGIWVYPLWRTSFLVHRNSGVPIFAVSSRLHARPAALVASRATRFVIVGSQPEIGSWPSLPRISASAPSGADNRAVNHTAPCCAKTGIDQP